MRTKAGLGGRHERGAHGLCLNALCGPHLEGLQTGVVACLSSGNALGGHVAGGDLRHCPYLTSLCGLSANTLRAYIGRALKLCGLGSGSRAQLCSLLGSVGRAIQRADALLKPWLVGGSQRQALGVAHAHCALANQANARCCQIGGLAHLVERDSRLVHRSLRGTKLATGICTTKQVG